MTETQTTHLNKILENTHSLLVNKYVKGAKEHKSELNRDYTASQLVEMAIEEAIDQITYLLTLRDSITALEAEVKNYRRAS